MGFFRSQLFAILDQVLFSANEIQKDRESGQISFFDSFEKEQTFQKSFQSVPNIPEWPENELLLNEKEMLGFYVTGHPLLRYQKELKSYSTVSTGTVGARRDGGEVGGGGVGKR